jgi:hypothetical protein
MLLPGHFRKLLPRTPVARLDAGEYSIADIACFPWIRVHKMANLSLEGKPNVQTGDCCPGMPHSDCRCTHQITQGRASAGWIGLRLRDGDVSAPVAGAKSGDSTQQPTPS